MNIGGTVVFSFTRGFLKDDDRFEDRHLLARDSHASIGEEEVVLVELGADLRDESSGKPAWTKDLQINCGSTSAG